MRSKFVTAVLSVWGWSVLVVSMLVFLPVVAFVRLVTYPFDKGAYAAGYVFRKVVTPLGRLQPLWTFRTSGVLPDDMRRPYVVVANHESFVDMVLVSHLPTEMKWLSKVEIMKIPILGWMMKMVRDVPLERGDAGSATTALDQCRERLRDRVSVMIFPEGTRSKTGALRPFKAGAFRLAIDGQYPILPLAVYGTRDCLRANDWRQRRAVAEVRVLEPISTVGMTNDDLDELRDRVRSIIVDARDDLRREHALTFEVGSGVEFDAEAS